MEKIGCVAVLHHPSGRGFWGIQCLKGRGIILPGGRFEPEKEKTYHETACRELDEEMRIKAYPGDCNYLWHGPDGYGYNTFAFLVNNYYGEPQKTLEGIPVQASWDDLFKSKFAGWYAVLREVMIEKQCISILRK